MLLCICLTAWPSRADEASPFGPFGELLEQHVTEYELPGGGLLSSFDYQAALRNPASRGLLEYQSRLLSEFDPGHLDSRDRAIAFWVNAYNFFTMRLLLENAKGDRPAGSVRDFGTLFDWYSHDFTEQTGSVEGFVRAHGSAGAQALLDRAERIGFISYDWAINSPENVEAIVQRILDASGGHSPLPFEPVQ